MLVNYINLKINNGKIGLTEVNLKKSDIYLTSGELVIKDVSFDFVINEVKSGKADFAAAGISITPERAEEVDFTMEYTTSNQVVVVKKDSSITEIIVIKQKPKKQEVIKIASFFITLYLGTILAFIIPLRPTYSETEKRSLQEFPAFTLEALYTGDFFDNITLWFSDTFPLREGMTRVNTALKSLSGFSI